MGCSQSRSSSSEAVQAPPVDTNGGGGGTRPKSSNRTSLLQKMSIRKSSGVPTKLLALDESIPSIQKTFGPGPEMHRTIRGLKLVTSSSPAGSSGATGSPPTAQTYARVTSLCHSDPLSASYVDPDTGQTPLHVACRVMTADAPPLDAIRSLIRAAPNTVGMLDGAPPGREENKGGQKEEEGEEGEEGGGNLALHYALMPPVEETSVGGANGEGPAAGAASSWRDRAAVVSALVSANMEVSAHYLGRTNVAYPGSERGEHAQNSLGCTPLYHAIAIVPDDFHPSPGPSYDFVRSVYDGNPAMATVANASDGDKPLALLYRRFSRQFDLSEKFFPGDNSRKEIVQYRRRYRASAMNTWRIIQLLLRPAAAAASSGDAMSGGGSATAVDRKMVHSAVAIDCPADLLRYIVETKPDQVREPEVGTGRLPLHCAAAAAVPPSSSSSSCDDDGGGDDEEDGGVDDDEGSGGKSTPSFPAYHSKFVIDELLYAYPDAAAARDGDGKLPLCLAIESGKTWIGGGIKSLFDVYPDAIEEIDMDKYPSIHEAMSFSSQQQQQQEQQTTPSHSQSASEGGEEGGSAAAMDLKAVKKEEHHDAIMLVQSSDADLGDIVSAMWANEEDGGVQMLGCMAVTKLAHEAKEKEERNDGSGQVVIVALTALTAVVNAMKNHPNEPAVQEKACGALLALSSADGQREVSFAASGAVASIVAALQAHVSDAIVQREACAALHNIVRRGGADRATVIASVSGFTAIQNSLGAHPDDVGVQREACRALEAITSYEDANLPELLGLQAAPLLQLAAEKFPDECRESADAVLDRISGMPTQEEVLENEC